MLEVKIPKEIPEIIEPKIPFTNIPNPIGTAKLIYKNGDIGYIQLYYLQNAILFVKRKIERIYLKIYIKTKKGQLDILNNKLMKSDK